MAVIVNSSHVAGIGVADGPQDAAKLRVGATTVSGVAASPSNTDAVIARPSPSP